MQIARWSVPRGLRSVLETSWEHFRAIWERPRVSRERFGGLLGAFWGVPGRSGGDPGAPWSVLGSVLGRPGTLRDAPGAILVRFGVDLDSIWGRSEPFQSDDSLIILPRCCLLGALTGSIWLLWSLLAALAGYRKPKTFSFSIVCFDAACLTRSASILHASKLVRRY